MSVVFISSLLGPSIHGLSHVPLVSDKSRLAPMTMPGLHLQAASMETVVCQHFSELFLT